MHPNALLPLASSLLSLGLAALVLDQFARRRRPYHAMWAAGLLWYGVAAGAEFLGGAIGWDETLYRVWYLVGAIGVAAYLGAGTVFLLGRTPLAWVAVGALALGSLPALAARQTDVGIGGAIAAAGLAYVRWRNPARFSYGFAGAVIGGGLFAAGRVFAAPIDLAALPAGPDQIVSGHGFPASVRLLSPLFNIPGAAALVGGALLSALHYYRTRATPSRVVSNALIALGAFLPAMTGSLSRIGLTGAFFAGELLGVVCIAAGFLVGLEGFAVPRVRAPGATLQARPVSN